MLTVNFSKKLRHFTLHISHEWDAGCHVIFGENGCGKSTLLRCLAGFTSIDHGTIQFNQTAWHTQHHKFPIEKRGIGWVGQHSALIPHLTVEQHLSLAKRHHHNGLSHPEKALHTLNIRPLCNQYAHELSSGELQRAALAIALANRPKLLLLDEPFAHLDVFSNTLIRQQLRELFNTIDIPVLLVTHHLTDIKSLAHSVCWMAQGAVKSHGCSNEVLKAIQLQLPKVDP